MKTDELIEILSRLGKEFEENELAYLSLTDKNERQIEDKLSYILYRKSEACNNGEMWIREHGRTGLICVKNGKITDRIQLKSIYTYDINKNLQKFIIGKPVKKIANNNIQQLKDGLLSDYYRNRSINKNNVNMFGILVATHPLNIKSNTTYKEVLRNYMNTKSKIQYMENNIQVILSDGDKKIKELLDERKKNDPLLNNLDYELKKTYINVGKAFYTDVGIGFWIIKFKEKI